MNLGGRWLGAIEIVRVSFVGFFPLAQQHLGKRQNPAIAISVAQFSQEVDDGCDRFDGQLRTDRQRSLLLVVGQIGYRLSLSSGPFDSPLA